MTIQLRRERDRAQRHRLIIDTARDIAESEGWDAVTTRRLADRVEYSQPVLYSHFTGKDAIVAAVAVDGFDLLAGELRRARDDRAHAATALRALADVYLRFARERPALYEAMFVRPVDVAFGGDATPSSLRSAFGEFRAALEPLAGSRDPETLAEIVWSSLHGLATLAHGRRLRPDHHEDRLDLLVDQLVSGQG